MENIEYTLDNWFVTQTTDGMDPDYTPPECWRTAIAGTVYGHPAYKDGTEIVLGCIKDFDSASRTLKTKTETIVLKCINQDYVINFEDPSSKSSVEERVFNALVQSVNSAKNLSQSTT